MDAARGGAAPLSFDVSLAQFPAGAQRFRVPVTFEIPASEIQFTQANEKRSASLLIVGLVRDQEGKIVTRVGAPVNMSATADEYKVLEKGSVSFTNTIELAPGQYSFEAFVRDQNSAKGSVRDYSLQLAPPGDKLSASSIVLGSQADPLREGEQEAELVLGKAKVLPSARRKFKNGENLIYLFNVYNFGANGQKRPAPRGAGGDRKARREYHEAAALPRGPVGYRSGCARDRRPVCCAQRLGTRQVFFRGGSGGSEY